MIRRIEIENFMSHATTVIEPAWSKSGGGLTVLVGDNNSGKSAVVAALQAVCRNASGSFMVRHGESNCRVTIETENEQTGERHQCVWQRIKGKVSYVVNGREVGRLKGSVPDDLHQYLRMPLVETNRDEVDIHFGEQKSPIFLLNDKAVDRAAFFASSSDTIRLIEMQDLHRIRVRDANRDRQRCLKEQEQLQERAKLFDPLDQIESRLTELESQHSVLVKNLHKADALRSLMTTINVLQARNARLKAELKSLNQLQPVPKINPVPSLRRLVDRIYKASQQREYFGSNTGIYQKVKMPPQLKPTSELQSITGELREFEIRHAAVSNQVKLLNKLSTPPDTRSTTHLQTAIRRIVEAKKNFEIATEQLSSKFEQLADLEHELRQRIAQDDICETCGQKVDADTLLNRSSDNPKHVSRKPATQNRLNFDTPPVETNETEQR